MSSAASSSGGIGVFGLTFVVLLVLKLTGYIAISWWWVFSPLWIGFLIWIVVFSIALTVMWLGSRR